MNLSSAFTIEELCRSELAARRGITNTPNEEQIERLTWLCVHVLQPIRNKVGRVILVSSGFRSPEVNALAGGAVESAHLQGRAADIEIYGMANLALAKLIVSMNLPQLDKCILEFPRANDPQAGWVHVQVPPKNGIARAERFTAYRLGSRTLYEQGLFVPQEAA